MKEPNGNNRTENTVTEMKNLLGSFNIGVEMTEHAQWKRTEELTQSEKEKIDWGVSRGWGETQSPQTCETIQKTQHSYHQSQKRGEWGRS